MKLSAKKLRAAIDTQTAYQTGMFYVNNEAMNLARFKTDIQHASFVAKVRLEAGSSHVTMKKVLEYIKQHPKEYNLEVD